MNNYEVVVGQHSILEILKHAPNRVIEIYFTDEANIEFQKKFQYSISRSSFKQKLLAPHDLQTTGCKMIESLGFTYSRIPSGLFITVTPHENRNSEWMIDQFISRDNFKVFCVDQVTDVNNIAAIIRTAAFYAVDAILIAQKGEFRLSPSFYRIASGAAEYVEIVQTNNLSKTLSKLISAGVEVIGFSEHSNTSDDFSPNLSKICLVMGAEDTGISNAVMRIIPKIIAFKPKGPIQSLNVSVASAIAMEKYFR